MNNQQLFKSFLYTKFNIKNKNKEHNERYNKKKDLVIITKAYSAYLYLYNNFNGSIFLIGRILDCETSIRININSIKNDDKELIKQFNNKKKQFIKFLKNESYEYINDTNDYLIMDIKKND